MPSWRTRCACLKSKIEDDCVMLDYRNANLEDVPSDVFQQERTLEELLIDSNHIRDLPRELFCCQNLRRLYLSDNELTRIPPMIDSLLNLEILKVSKNALTVLPDSLGDCKKLKVLDLSINPLDRLPDSVTHLSNLVELYLYDAFLESLPTRIGRLCNLSVLELRENSLHSLPSSLAQLTQLKILDISFNDFDSLPDVIGSLSSLQELWCDNNHITCIPAFIGRLSKLEILEASKNEIVEINDDINHCTSLTDLHLSFNLLRHLPTQLGGLINLKTLKLDCNSLDSLPETMGGMTSLEELDISSNNLTNLPHSISSLTNLSALYADDNFITSLPQQIGGCVGLTVLSLRCNNITQLPDTIGSITHLSVLNLMENRLRFLPLTLLKLAHLRALWLADNQIKPLVTLQRELDPGSGGEVLTCYLLPQRSPLHPSPSFHSPSPQKQQHPGQQLRCLPEQPSAASLHSEKQHGKYQQQGKTFVAEKQLEQQDHVSQQQQQQQQHRSNRGPRYQQQFKQRLQHGRQEQPVRQQLPSVPKNDKRDKQQPEELEGLMKAADSTERLGIVESGEGDVEMVGVDKIEGMGLTRTPTPYPREMRKQMQLLRQHAIASNNSCSMTAESSINSPATVTVESSAAEPADLLQPSAKTAAVERPIADVAGTEQLIAKLAAVVLPSMAVVEKPLAKTAAVEQLTAKTAAVELPTTATVGTSSTKPAAVDQFSVKILNQGDSATLHSLQTSPQDSLESSNLLGTELSIKHHDTISPAFSLGQFSQGGWSNQISSSCSSLIQLDRSPNRSRVRLIGMSNKELYKISEAGKKGGSKLPPCEEKTETGNKNWERNARTKTEINARRSLPEVPKSVTGQTKTDIRTDIRIDIRTDIKSGFSVSEQKSGLEIKTHKEKQEETYRNSESVCNGVLSPKSGTVKDDLNKSRLMQNGHLLDVNIDPVDRTSRPVINELKSGLTLDASAVGNDTFKTMDSVIQSDELETEIRAIKSTGTTEIEIAVKSLNEIVGTEINDERIELSKTEINLEEQRTETKKTDNKDPCDSEKIKVEEPVARKAKRGCSKEKTPEMIGSDVGISVGSYNNKYINTSLMSKSEVKGSGNTDSIYNNDSILNLDTSRISGSGIIVASGSQLNNIVGSETKRFGYSELSLVVSPGMRGQTGLSASCGEMGRGIRGIEGVQRGSMPDSSRGWIEKGVEGGGKDEDGARIRGEKMIEMAAKRKRDLDKIDVNSRCRAKDGLYEMETTKPSPALERAISKFGVEPKRQSIQNVSQYLMESVKEENKNIIEEEYNDGINIMPYAEFISQMSVRGVNRVPPGSKPVLRRHDDGSYSVKMSHRRPVSMLSRQPRRNHGYESDFVLYNERRKKGWYESEGYRSDGYRGDDYRGASGYHSDGYRHGSNQGSLVNRNYSIGYQDNGYQGNVHQGNVHQGNGYQGNGYQGNSYQGNGYQGGSSLLPLRERNFQSNFPSNNRSMREVFDTSNISMGGSYKCQSNYSIQSDDVRIGVAKIHKTSSVCSSRRTPQKPSRSGSNAENFISGSSECNVSSDSGTTKPQYHVTTRKKYESKQGFSGITYYSPAERKENRPDRLNSSVVTVIEEGGREGVGVFEGEGVGWGDVGSPFNLRHVSVARLGYTPLGTARSTNQSRDTLGYQGEQLSWEHCYGGREAIDGRREGELEEIDV